MKSAKTLKESNQERHILTAGKESKSFKVSESPKGFATLHSCRVTSLPFLLRSPAPPLTVLSWLISCSDPEAYVSVFDLEVILAI
jgi:hypothetical protein